MALYDQNQPTTGTPRYAQQKTVVGSFPRPTVTPPATQVNQFAWVNNPGVVDMWPMAPGSEMTFIDGEHMMVYVKRVDEYNHPLKVRKFKLTEILDEEPATNPTPPQPAIDMEELKRFLSSEVDRAVGDRINRAFGYTNTTAEVANA